MKRLKAESYRNRIADLRRKMKEKDIDAYYVVTDDFHASEYVGDHFKCREFLSGFDGSAGEMVITAEEARLWTDGRYFLQAADQLEGTGIQLMKSGEKDVPRIPDYLAKTLTPHSCLAYDGRTVSNAAAEEIEKACLDKKLSYRIDVDLVGDLWTDRPALSAEPAWLLDEKYTGESRRKKLARVREEMEKLGCEAHVIASLDDIAWLYQLRGNDVAYNPVVLSYSLILKDKAILYVNEDVISAEVRSALEADGVELRPYNRIYTELGELVDGMSVLLDKKKSNRALYTCIPVSCKVEDHASPVTLFKACKTATEVQNERIAHIQDGVAVTKICCYLKTQLQGSEELLAGKVTELDVSERLLNFRKERPDFIEQSFEPIIATGAHGAIVHYEPTEETNAKIENNTFLLMDTGGQYYQGTTDITRTVLLGEGTEEMKRNYTAVLKGHLDLADAVFKKGITGVNLDVLARKPLWELGLDYNHGTGHGVGYLLNVHEGPQGIRLRDAGGKIGAPFEEGMITSDEPGVYLTGKYGIRIENLMACVKKGSSEYGDFLGFEMLTMVPYDLDAILPDMLTEHEKELLNGYHKKVRETIAPYLTAEEKAWLEKATTPVQ